jgi:signal transduction histidine kinase
MTPLLRRRLISFGMLIIGLSTLAAWSAFTAWRELGTLRRRLTTAEFESFRIAGELQSNVLGVNSALLAYALSSDAGEWQRFQKDSEMLNGWIGLQRGLLKTAQEKRVLADIDTEYDHYLAVAQAVRQGTGDAATRASMPVQQLDDAAGRMFVLAKRLADAHRAALGDVLRQSQRSLRRLETIFGGGFALILAVGAWGTRIFFHETITPLRRQLVESQALAERQEKLASLGLLTAGVAHEIRNPLTAIKLQAYMLRECLEDAAPARENVAVIENQISRLERIVTDFLIFARPGDPQFVTVTASDLFAQIRALLAPELAENDIELSVETGATELPFRADLHQLEQVLINLVRNGAESIGHHGRITLRAVSRRLPLRGKLQGVIVLEVDDTGAGIPAHVQARLFDPFYTTKPTGTGLGLSIAMRIMERHGGTLQLETAPGKGTTFGMVLPRQPSVLQANNPSIQSASTTLLTRQEAVKSPASLGMAAPSTR